MPDARIGAWPVLLAAAALAVVAGCRHLPSHRGMPECPGELVATAAMGDDFRWRASARFSEADESFEFQVVAEKRGDDLHLLGLHALGAKLFSLTQRGTDVSVDALPGAVLPVPPENVLRDLHRMRFPERAARGDVAIVRDVPPQTGPVDAGERVRIQNFACGVTSEYTTLVEPAAAANGGAP